MKRTRSPHSRLTMSTFQLTYRCPPGMSPLLLSGYEKTQVLKFVILQLVSTGIPLEGPITIWLCSDIPNACEEELIFADRHAVQAAQQLARHGSDAELSSWLFLNRKALGTLPAISKRK